MRRAVEQQHSRLCPIGYGDEHGSGGKRLVALEPWIMPDRRRRFGMALAIKPFNPGNKAGHAGTKG